MKRKLDDWLTSYEEYTSYSEAPASYHTWTGISCIAGALQRKVYIKWPRPIYPNNFIILVGPSGHARKNDAIQEGKVMLKSLTMPIISDDNSPESIIQQLAEDCAITFNDGDRTKVQTTATAFTPELATFTGNRNGKFLVYLTDWYDCADSWERRTKHQGIDTIRGLCFNLLGATAPDWIPYILTEEATGGGFTSRCIFIVEEDKGKIVADPNLLRPSPALKEDLLFDLECINMLTGELKFDEEAYELYTAWYIETMESDQRGDWAIPDPLFRGYCARRATHIKKLCMALSTSRGDSLEISGADWERGLNLLTAAENKMPNVFARVGTAAYVQQTADILAYITQNKKVTKADIMNRFYRSVDGTTLEVVIKVLVDMKKIRVILDIEGEDTRYEYIEDISASLGTS